MDQVIANTPLAQPPKGQKANYVNPENLSAVTISLVSIANFFGVAFVVLRMYARASLRTRPTPDDCEYLEPSGGALSECVQMPVFSQRYGTFMISFNTP